MNGIILNSGANAGQFFRKQKGLLGSQASMCRDTHFVRKKMAAEEGEKKRKEG